MLKRVLIQAGAVATVGALLLYFGHTVPGAIVLTVATILVTLALFVPSAHQTLDGLTRRLGRLIAAGIGAVMLTLIYFTVFTAVAFWWRMLRKDPLNRDFGDGRTSNWIARSDYGRRDAYAKLFSYRRDDRAIHPAGK